MYKQYFGLTHAPLGKQTKNLWGNEQYDQLKTQVEWLLESPGIGLLSGHSGTGKTAALRHFTQTINPHKYKIIYQPDTEFTRYEIYSRLADSLGLEVSHRCSKLWKDIKSYMLDLVDNKHITPVWILDEAQNLPADFLNDLPSFLNFAFDSRDIITIILVGLPNLNALIKRPSYMALSSRMQMKFNWKSIDDKKQFSDLINFALKDAGCAQTLLSDSGISLIHMSSQGRIRIAHQILVNALRLACQKSLNHLTDETIHDAIEMIK